MSRPQLKTSNARTNLVFGPPGTGKTTTLLGLVEEALSSGVPPDRIAYLAFTKKAANEAAERACAKFNMQREDLPYFRTLHSLAFRLLGLQRSEVMQTEDYRNLGTSLGCYTFEHQYNETIERAPVGGGLGDRCLRLYALAKATRQPLETIRAQAEDPGVDERGLIKFALALDDYKAQTLKLDFTDFLDNCHEELDLDLFILDEAQDLTAQQWAFARRLAKRCPRVYIAGDDDQAIFQWAGADLKTFTGFKGDRYTLPMSYRLPQKIYQVARAVASRITQRTPKDWLGREEPGTVNWMGSTDHFDLSQGTWMFLVRRNGQRKSLVDLCRNAGVVYQNDGHWSNQTHAIRSVLAYERLRRGERIAPSEARRVSLYAGARMEDATSYVWDNITWPFADRPDWMRALPGLPTEDREYIRLLRRNGESLVNPGRVVVSTIHGVKGGQADNVVLFPKLNKRIQRSFLYDPDQEHRVWYVAVSRAIHNLYLVNQPAPFFYPVP